MKRALLLIVPLAAVLAGCSSSSSSTPTITIPKAHVYKLIDKSPATGVSPGRPATVGFTVQQPSGKPLTRFKTGPGPHTGIHVIVVADDLSTIIHRHPPPDAQGHVSEQVVLPRPGDYTVLADIYPMTGPIPNFQLRYDIHADGKASPKPLPAFKAKQTVDGYTVDLHGNPKLRVAVPKILKATVTGPNGKPAPFDVWYGALAHAIFFRKGTLAYFHTHVCGRNTPGCTSHRRGSRTIIAQSTQAGACCTSASCFPARGRGELFLQFKCEREGP